MEVAERILTLSPGVAHGGAPDRLCGGGSGCRRRTASSAAG
ncbi:hypothetical protein ACWD4J_20355 [Streptomyces sp. NPDC002577]